MFRIYKRINDIANCQESIMKLLRKIVVEGHQDTLLNKKANGPLRAQSAVSLSQNHVFPLTGGYTYIKTYM